jgi:hypothetical protein
MSIILSTKFLVAVAACTASTTFAASIPMLDLPIMGGEAGELYKMSEQPNSVFVFEGLRLDCSYCNQNAPAVDQLAEEMAASQPRVQVLDLCIDSTDSQCTDWFNRHKPNHPVVRDVGRKVFTALKTQNVVPQVFVVNCKGEMTGAFVGNWGSTGATTVRSLISKALETTCE